MDPIIRERISDSIKIKQQILENDSLLNTIEKSVELIVKCLREGGKLVLCGNGGSASDVLHFAGEIVGRFQKEREPWPAIVLNSDVATLTAIANDYGYDETFARQAKAYLTDKDVLIGVSTSGNSENVYKAMVVAHERNATSIAFLGKDGGKINQEATCSIVIPCETTARIQECHIMLIHVICEMVENKLSNGKW